MTRTFAGCALVGLCVSAVTLAPEAAWAFATIYIVNNDGPGEGFNDPTPVAPVGGNPGTTLGEQRLNAAQYAANLLGQCLNSAVFIHVQAQMDPQFCSATTATLGSAGASFVHKDWLIGNPPPAANTWYPQALASAIAGVDVNPGTPEVIATFNSALDDDPLCLGGIGWYYGHDGNAGSAVDFVTVVVHEICHGLGMQTYVNLLSGEKLMGFNDTYMLNLEQHGAAPPDWPSMTNAQRNASAGGDPDLHWVGTSVTTAAPAILVAGIGTGGHVRMHGPSPVSPGSSVSHFSSALSPSELMEPAYTGVIHDARLAVHLFEDVGWDLQDRTVNQCHGSVVDLASPSGPPPNSADGLVHSGEERGVFITALKDFQLCGIAMKLNHYPLSTIEAYVYEADGNTRRSFVAAGAALVLLQGEQFLYVPVDATLEACKEYNIGILFGQTISWPWSDETVIEEPFHAAGVIRVRDGEMNGDASNTMLPHFQIVGNAFSPSSAAALEPPGHNYGTCSDGSSARGVYLTAKQTLRLCAVRFEYDAPSAPTVLRANLYEASGTVRGNLIATGTAEVNGGPLQFHQVSLNALLLEGRDYDLEVAFTPASWGCTNDYGSPFTVDDAIIVVDGELGGDASNTYLPHLVVSYDLGAGGEARDLVGPFHGPPFLVDSQDFYDYGIYVKALGDQELVSLGWRADVVQGEMVRARVYEATGTTRGPLIAEGEIVVASEGMRWHDIPVAASLQLGQEYDFEIDIPDVNVWEWWHDGLPPGKPYNAYGLLQVLDGEQGGDASNVALPHLRMSACPPKDAPTAADAPTRTARFTLEAPHPNPVSTSAAIHYSLDAAGPVTIAVYDVKGRLVATLLNHENRPAGAGQVELDARFLAAGVYFVRMDGDTRSAARKIAVVR